MGRLAAAALRSGSEARRRRARGARLPDVLHADVGVPGRRQSLRDRDYLYHYYY